MSSLFDTSLLVAKTGAILFAIAFLFGLPFSLDWLFLTVNKNVRTIKYSVVDSWVVVVEFLLDDINNGLLATLLNSWVVAELLDEVLDEVLDSSSSSYDDDDDNDGLLSIIIISYCSVAF